MALDQLEQQNSQPPNINFMRVRFSQNHFGCHVLHRSTQGHPGLELRREAKIANLDGVFVIEKDVFWLS